MVGSKPRIMENVYIAIAVVLVVIIPIVFLILLPYYGMEVDERIRFWIIIGQMIGVFLNILIALRRRERKNLAQSK
jgi:hypothetical protein